MITTEAQRRAAKKYQRKIAARWELLGCCKLCGVPCKPYKHCFKCRLQHAKIEKACYRRKRCQRIKSF